MLKRVVYIAVFILFSMTIVVAGDSTACQPQAMKIWDILNWENIIAGKISHNGNWFAWEVGELEDNGELHIKDLQADTTYSYDTGFKKNPYLEFSSNDNFLLFTIAPDKKTYDKLKEKKESVKNKLGIVNLKTGGLKEIDDIRKVKTPEYNSNWVGIHLNIPENRSDKSNWKGSDLILYHLLDSNYYNFGNVSEFQFDKYGKWLVMLIDTENETGNCVLLRNMKTGEIKSIESDNADYTHLQWTKEGDGFCLLKAKKHEDYTEEWVSVIGFRALDGNSPDKIIIDPEDIDEFPENMTVSPHATPRWKEELDGIFFGIHKIEKTKEALAKEDSSSSVEDEEEKIPNMVIWHWKDKRLQSQQWVNEKIDKEFNYTSYFDCENKKFYPMANDSVRHYVRSKRGRYAVGYDREKYYLQASLEGRTFFDIYVFDLETGNSYLALEKIRWYFGCSPDYNYFFYYENGDFYTYNMKKQESINITEKIPVSFIDVDDDHNVENPPVIPLDWSLDGKYVLLSDGWDIWKVHRDGKKFVNLTEIGRKNQVRFLTEYRIYPEDEHIDLDKDIYLKMYGEYSKKNGIGLLKKGRAGIDGIFFSDHEYRELIKARDEETFVFTREDYKNYPDYYLAKNNFDDFQQITFTNPQQDEVLWCSGGKIINYVTEAGDSLQGVLYLPADYSQGKKYPTIVYMYEKLSQRANHYLRPRLAGIMNFSYYTSNGYAVFTPDITYQLNDPGMSAVDCITSGLTAAIATGVVDENKLGIQGHSWGGYQTSFVITQTNMFKAACAGAPLTNMLSMYSSIYWNTGGANMAIFESSQGRFKGGYWDNLDAYTRNSPVYHAKNVETPLLMLHNDKDGAVDWNQGIEYYNTLRRMRKPVVMLEYKGENHGLRKTVNQKDYTLRMKEFFDHYLMDAEAPKWWREGIPYIDLEDHLEGRTDLLKPKPTVTYTVKCKN